MNRRVPQGAHRYRDNDSVGSMHKITINQTAKSREPAGYRFCCSQWLHSEHGTWQPEDKTAAARNMAKKY